MQWPGLVLTLFSVDYYDRLNANLDLYLKLLDEGSNLVEFVVVAGTSMQLNEY